MRKFIKACAKHCFLDLMMQETALKDSCTFTMTPRKCWDEELWEETLQNTMDDFIQDELNAKSQGVYYSWELLEKYNNEYVCEITYEIDVDFGITEKPSHKFEGDAEKWVSFAWGKDDEEDEE